MGNTDLVVVDLVVILMQMHFDNYVNKYKLNILVIIFLESYLSKHSIKSFNLIAYTHIILFNLIAYTLYIIQYRVSQNVGPTLFLSFSWVLEHVQRNFWPLFNRPNLLHDSHKKFENWFRNSWDNWCQSWHPSFRNWQFPTTQIKQNNFDVTCANFNLNYLSYFWINF